MRSSPDPELEGVPSQRRYRAKPPPLLRGDLGVIRLLRRPGARPTLGYVDAPEQRFFVRDPDGVRLGAYGPSSSPTSRRRTPRCASPRSPRETTTVRATGPVLGVATASALPQNPARPALSPLERREGKMDTGGFEPPASALRKQRSSADLRARGRGGGRLPLKNCPCAGALTGASGSAERRRFAPEQTDPRDEGDQERPQVGPHFRVR